MGHLGEICDQFGCLLDLLVGYADGCESAAKSHPAGLEGWADSPDYPGLCQPPDAVEDEPSIKTELSAQFLIGLLHQRKTILKYFKYPQIKLVHKYLSKARPTVAAVKYPVF